MPLLAKERGQPDLIKAQVLVSPLIDAADLSRPSYKQFQYGDFMNKAAIEVCLGLCMHLRMCVQMSRATEPFQEGNACGQFLQFLTTDELKVSLVRNGMYVHLKAFAGDAGSGVKFEHSTAYTSS